jgi:chaperonin GroEL (HSP60 family)
MDREGKMSNSDLISPNFGRLKGKRAWRQNLNLAAMSAQKIESALGPKGAYKMVTFNRGPERIIKVTKDSVEMLKELEVQYPAVKTLAEAARLHREEVGDGVGTMVILIAGLLRESEALLDKKIHPNVILRGYVAATKEAIKIIDTTAVEKGDSRNQILDVADCGRGLLTPKLRAALLEAAERAESQGGIDLKRIRVITKSGGSVADSRLIRGVMVKKERMHPSMPGELRNVKVAMVNKTFDNKPLEVLMKGQGPFHIKLDITEAQQMEKFRAQERRLNDDLVEAVDRVGGKVVFCRAKIVKPVADEMSRRGMLAFELIDQADMDAVAEATGATTVGDVKNLEAKDLGQADRVAVEKIENLDYAVVEAAKGSTIFLRGSQIEHIDETERVVKNVVRLFRNAKKDSKTVLGGGAIYMQIAEHLREFALSFPGKEQVAIEAYARVLELVAASLVRNYGLSWSKTMPELRSYHAKGVHAMGIAAGGCTDMDKLGIRELASTPRAAIRRAYDVTSLLLRVDEYFYVRELAMVHKQI